MNSERVFIEMKNCVTSGQWKRGDKIPTEVELAKMFAVSRNSIREHIQRLVAMEVLIIRHGEGTFVKDSDINEYFLNSFIPLLTLDKSEFVDMMAFKSAVMMECIQFACCDRTEKDIKEIYECIALFKQNIQEPVQYILLMKKCDNAIVDVSKNILLSKMIVKLNDIIFANAEMHMDTSCVYAAEKEAYENLYLQILKRNNIEAKLQYSEILEKYMNRFALI